MGGLCGHCKRTVPVTRKHFCVGMETSRWGGGVGGMITFLVLAHMLDAMPLPLLLRVHTCSVLRQCWGGGVFFFCRVEMVDSGEYYIYYVV